MNEMKPEDVMRALEHCANYKSQEVSCIGCPLYGKCDVNILEGLALALLREKDAEIERLNDTLADALVRAEIAKDETIIEFAERIVNAIHPEYPISVCQVYRIAKEMKEGDK